MRSALSTTAIIVGLATAGAAGFGQATPHEHAATSPPPQQQQRPPVFEATVQRVRVDVIVTDEEGRFVDDLTADDFIVLEDGEPRRVLRVQLIDLVQGRIVELEAKSDPTTTDPERPGETPEPTHGVLRAADSLRRGIDLASRPQGARLGQVGAP